MICLCTGIASADAAPEIGKPEAETDSLRPVPRFTAAPLLYVQPETGFAFGAGGIWYHRPHHRVRAGHSLSSMNALVVYTLRGQLITQISGDLYTDADHWRFSYQAGYFDYPYFFYGIGNDNPEDAKESYTNRYPLLNLGALRQVSGNLLLGAGILLEHNRFSELDSSGQLISGAIPGVEGGLNWGLGPQLLYDSRDNVLASWKGWYAGAGVQFHREALGSVRDYTNWTLDLRRFVSLSTVRPAPEQQKRALLPPRPAATPHVLAFQLYGNWVSGDVPFHRLAQLGGPEQMRGFFAGRQRDQLYLCAQAEYRFPIWRFLYGAAFASTAQVQPEWSAWQWSALHYAGGGGLRLQLSAKDRNMIRLDYAFGDGGNRGFYLQFTESF